MALSTTGYNAAGAGTAAANGNYAPCAAPNATFNGATQYTNGTYFLKLGGNGYWVVNDTASIGGVNLYTGGNGGSTTSFSLTGWGVNDGTAPAPTFTTISGAAPASAPRLQPRVVVF